jgi:hypothetical protein
VQKITIIKKVKTRKNIILFVAWNY